MPGFSSHDFTRGNVRPAARVWTTKQFVRCTANPDFATADKGCIRLVLRAHSPNFVGNPSGRLGTIKTGDGVDALDISNPNLTFAYQNYTHAILLEQRIKVFAIPSGAASNHISQGLASGVSYCPTAQVILHNTKTLPANTSDTLSGLAVDGTLAREYNSQVRFTRQTYGSRAHGAVLEGVYRPKKLYQVQDLLDHVPDFKFTTGGNVTTFPDNECTNKAYWVVQITPTRAGATNTTGTGVVHGRVLPHRLSIEVTSKVLFYFEDPSAGISQAAGGNVPVDAGNPVEAGGDSWATNAGQAMVAGGAALLGENIRRLRRRLD